MTMIKMSSASSRTYRNTTIRHLAFVIVASIAITSLPSSSTINNNSNVFVMAQTVQCSPCARGENPFTFDESRPGRDFEDNEMDANPVQCSEVIELAATLQDGTFCGCFVVSCLSRT